MSSQPSQPGGVGTSYGLGNLAVVFFAASFLSVSSFHNFSEADLQGIKQFAASQSLPL